MSTWNPENDVDLLSGSEDEEEVAMKRDYHGREALLFVVDANLQTHTFYLIHTPGLANAPTIFD